jgi:ribosomal protein S6
VTKYEGLFILNLAGSEEGVKDAIDRISKSIGDAGGKIETVQKMDKRAFTRVTDKAVTGGFYVNVIFAAEPAVLGQLTPVFANDKEVWRVLFTKAPKIAVPVAA